VEVARSTLDSLLPNVGCTWLDVTGIQPGPPVAVAMRGVAGNVPTARGEVNESLSRAGLAGATTGFDDVATILPAGCSALDAFRQVRNDGADRISSRRARYELSTLQGGQLGARVPIEIDTNAAPDFALAGIEPSGEITPLLLGRAALQERMANSGDQIADLGNGRYRIGIDITHDGWSGFLLLTGTGPFEASLIAPDVGERGPDWQQQFREAASRGNWRSNMLWVRTQDQQPG
jgi:serine/threonine-protein kinase